jgi:sterol desaturase/sphingolipid hydroxylase (fatty acid hydroxylase superfamily)
MRQQFWQLVERILFSVVYGTFVLCIGAVIFAFLEEHFRFKRMEKRWQASSLDLKYAFLSFLYPPFINFLLGLVFAWQALHQSRSGHARVGPLRFAGELMAVLFIHDLLIYVRHRFFHTRPVWKFHSIHHSSEEVNWLSAVRFHPAENIIETLGQILMFVGWATMGVDPRVLFVASLLIAFFNFFIHSNLRWTFGPLKYLIVSPVFHRWHHSDTPEAMNKNFASIFAVIDCGLGTFYMPAQKAPRTTGLSGEERKMHPRSLTGQLFYPFKRWKRFGRRHSLKSKELAREKPA